MNPQIETQPRAENRLVPDFKITPCCYAYSNVRILISAVADDRHRRKSGDDVGIFGSPSRHKTIGSGAIFEAFRPRSKSDAQRAIKRPTIMSTVKNAVHVITNTTCVNLV